MQNLLLFAAGLAGLVLGASLLVRGASKLALSFGISPLVVGLTIVAFGTSAPEVAVSVGAVLDGKADIAIGNVVGSNIFNVLFILGVSAIIVPLVVNAQIIRLDVPIMIGVSLLTLVMSLDGRISVLEGMLLFAGIVAYTAFQIQQARKEKQAIQEEYAGNAGSRRGSSNMLMNIGLVIIGLVLLVVGSGWLVNGAIALAKVLGVDDLVIGLTIVAAGTSLPEVATSILAAIRKERDIAVGNVVGSNIFNILAVLGLSSIVSPNGLSVSPAIVAFDNPVMLVVAIACLPIFFTGREIARWEGVVFLGFYVAYTAYLILNAQAHAALPVFSNMMLYFVVPLTVITLLVVLSREFRKRKHITGSFFGVIGK